MTETSGDSENWILLVTPVIVIPGPVLVVGGVVFSPLYEEVAGDDGEEDENELYTIILYGSDDAIAILLVCAGFIDNNLLNSPSYFPSVFITIKDPPLFTNSK